MIECLIMGKKLGKSFKKKVKNSEKLKKTHTKHNWWEVFSLSLKFIYFFQEFKKRGGGIKHKNYILFQREQKPCHIAHGTGIKNSKAPSSQHLPADSESILFQPCLELL